MNYGIILGFFIIIVAVVLNIMSVNYTTMFYDTFVNSPSVVNLETNKWGEKTTITKSSDGTLTIVTNPVDFGVFTFEKEPISSFSEMNFTWEIPSPITDFYDLAVWKGNPGTDQYVTGFTFGNSQFNTWNNERKPNQKETVSYSGKLSVRLSINNSHILFIVNNGIFDYWPTEKNQVYNFKFYGYNKNNPSRTITNIKVTKTLLPPVPTGPTGPAGVQGPAGIQGPAGVQGQAGAQGPAGAVGPIGPTGPTVPMGSLGPTGPTGTNILTNVVPSNTVTKPVQESTSAPANIQPSTNSNVISALMQFLGAQQIQQQTLDNIKQSQLAKNNELAVNSNEDADLTNLLNSYYDESIDDTGTATVSATYQESQKNLGDIRSFVREQIRQELQANSELLNYKECENPETPAANQGREYSDKRPKAIGCESPEYIKKDEIPCWGCNVRY
jgi:hypothetical protein